METILVVDDDAAFRQLVLDILRSEGYRLLEAASGEEGLRILLREEVDLLLSDQRMPGMDGLELARRAQAMRRAPSVVLMTAYGTIPQAVEAIRMGVVDYLTKPFESPDTVRQTVLGALGKRRAVPASGSEFLTRSPAVLEVLALADRAATTDANVLISGESGTGKEVLARRIHERSARREGAFVGVNCAALPENLAESQLFGHERGAFTGANTRHHGYFEQADGGTLFLDELTELAAPVQAKLLRALEERSIRRLGGDRSIAVDLRLISASNRDLQAEMSSGRLRPDLFYRLNVVSLVLPPLRERPEDVELLAGRFTSSLAARLGVAARRLSPAAMESLLSHPWPGNVRELRNVLERALIAAEGEEIGPDDLPDLAPVRAMSPMETGGRGDISLKERERRAILDALERTGGHRERAAGLLGISVRTLYNRLKEFGIQ